MVVEGAGTLASGVYQRGKRWSLRVEWDLPRWCAVVASSGAVCTNVVSGGRFESSGLHERGKRWSLRVEQHARMW